MNFATSGKLSLAAILISAALQANAGISVEGEQGVFSIGGDVEFDINFRDSNTKNAQKLNQDGRLLVLIAGERSVSGDRYIKAQAQPLLKTTGDVDLDDAWIAFGQANNWELKVGRYEAFDLFPVGQDTMLEYANADKPQEFANGDVYRANKARGRGDNGQIGFSKTADNLYFELSTKFENESAADQNAVFVRPVVAYQIVESVRVAAGLEANLTADKDDADNDFLGYGATVNYSADDLSINVNYAFRDFDTKTQEDTTIGANLLFKGFGLGHVYGEVDTGSSEKVNTTYASYQFANVMDVEDFSVYLGTYYSKVDDTENKDLGMRIRLKYFF
ncbi:MULTISPECIES: carbohydrate porin [unclassified Vibrio]|uniref:carbohydrate porin n=1 Tax=unclassified Vibrio TaxID=2614977 RepID=UPI000B8ECB6C|nr:MULTISPECIES: carbohydrate porin [unclassified Vibrio]NAW91672.1 porin [Vibrio sp. V24_P1S3T111]OXX19311.1 porin [Vibrio sp. V05_P4A8T149]OXX25493.1 porin [Vibrio sp. V06_P1A73T115]OXX31693.1 porin [Vibrio sp. V14_P6S14T42]OXX38107.1 porin [Vibrio sp. V04_P4A5T148]